MPRGSIFDQPYYDEDYALWAYGVRFTDYDAAFLAYCGITLED